jgi:hypothetical protein
MHLVRPINDMQCATVSIHRSEREIIAQSRATENLYGPIDHPGIDFGRYDLNHRNLILGRFLTQVIDDPRGLER